MSKYGRLWAFLIAFTAMILGTATGTVAGGLFGFACLVGFLVWNMNNPLGFD